MASGLRNPTVQPTNILFTPFFRLMPEVLIDRPVLDPPLFFDPYDIRVLESRLSPVASRVVPNTQLRILGQPRDGKMYMTVRFFQLASPEDIEINLSDSKYAILAEKIDEIEKSREFMLWRDMSKEWCNLPSAWLLSMVDDILYVIQSLSPEPIEVKLEGPNILLNLSKYAAIDDVISYINMNVFEYLQTTYFKSALPIDPEPKLTQVLSKGFLLSDSPSAKIIYVPKTVPLTRLPIEEFALRVIDVHAFHVIVLKPDVVYTEAFNRIQSILQLQ